MLLPEPTLGQSLYVFSKSNSQLVVTASAPSWTPRSEGCILRARGRIKGERNDGTTDILISAAATEHKSLLHA